MTLCLSAPLWLGVPAPTAGERGEAQGPWARMALPGPELLTTGARPELNATPLRESSVRWAQAPPEPPPRAEEFKPEELGLPPPPTVPPPPPAPPEEVPLREFLAENLFLLADLTALGNWSKLEDRPGIFGGRVDGVLAPALRMREDLFLIALYNGFYDRRRQFFTEDEGPRQRTEMMKHEIVPTLRYDFLEHLSVSPHLFYTWVFARETAGESWGSGLYDYWDRGGGVDFKAAREVAAGEEDSARLTLQTFRRHYRNFKSLRFLREGEGFPVKFEKDFRGYLARVGVERKRRTGLLARLEYTFLHKLFTEDRVIDADLQTDDPTGERRRDNVHTVSGHVGYGWERGPVALVPKLNLTVRENRSNQHFNDDRGTLSPADDVFTKRYFDYRSYEIRPEVSYTFPLPFPPVGERLLTTTLSYTHSIRDYATRPAKEEDGTLKGSSEVDVKQTVALTMVLTLSERWALLAHGDWSRVRSNMEDERVFRFRYRIYNIGLGFKFHY